MKILVIGANGLIGSTMFRVLREKQGWTVIGTLRGGDSKNYFPEIDASNFFVGVDVEKADDLLNVLSRFKPDVVINCAGITKHRPECSDTAKTININALFPNRLKEYCALANARLIHISTDCVFAGRDGNYTEDSFADSNDVYGRSKILGEVGGEGVVTLRTSTIGHELNSSLGLLNWFLDQKETCKGFTRAVFSGLPTVVFAQVVRDVVIPNPDLHGLYQVAAQPINKYELLKLIAQIYEKKIEIIPDVDFVIDRSLSPNLFKSATGYVAPSWPDLIKIMHDYK